MKTMKHVQVFRILVLALVLMAFGAQAAGPWYVATNGADSNAGTIAAPYLTISNALTNASTGGDTIWVSNGVYTLTAMVSNPAAKKFNICAWSTNPADTVLLGPGSNNTANFRGVWMSGAGSLLQGFTVTNFYLTNENNGAGVYCSAGLISNCIITGNLMGYNIGNADGIPANIRANGGGVYLAVVGAVENCSIIGNSIFPANYDSGGGGVYMLHSGRIRNCRIVGNTVNGNAKGPGVFGGYLSDFIVQDSIIASNSGGAGGAPLMLPGGVVSNCRVFANSTPCFAGIAFIPNAAYPSSVRIERCVISNNVGVLYHGGCWISSSVTNLLISQCVIVSNCCPNGGNAGLGVDKAVQNAVIRNCLVAYNRAIVVGDWAGDNGGGMMVYATNALIENCTIVSNILTGAGAQGGGLYATNGVRVVNSIIYYNQNTANVSSNVYVTADCTFSNSCTAPLSAVVGTANIEANPQFVAKDTGNFRLNKNSPCVNTGMNSAWMTGAVDLDGRSRLDHFSRKVDMGAYEFLPAMTLFKSN